MEVLSFREWRALQWSRVPGPNILEVGVGTGKNFPHYPRGQSITAIDFSPAMLRRAQEKAKASGLAVDLRVMDVQRLEFGSGSFDAVVGSFVFCSVPNPEAGLAEIARVLKPGGRLVLLEHVLSDRPVAAWLMKRVSPLVVRLLGANLDRRTVESVATAGFRIEQVTDLSGRIIKLIEAVRVE
jgi:ubiquinone/menaquinone biosynthesis C-methylase UbiE